MLSGVKGYLNADNKNSLELIIRMGVVIVAVAVLLYALVALTWQLLLSDDTGVEAPVAVINTEGSSRATAVDIKQLSSLDLFGSNVVDDQPKPKAVEQKEAVVTRLSLILNGVMLSSVTENSVAIISYQKKQKDYHPGDKLPGGNRVKLLEVYADKVIIDNSGKTESLLLFAKNDLKTSVSRPKIVQAANKLDDRRKNKDTQRVLNDMRQRLKNNPASLMKIINARPYSENGQVIGYRVAPGREVKAFSQLGFERGDVIVAVNGESVSDPSKLMQLYKLASSVEQVSLSVLRQGQTIDLMVGVDE